MRESHTRSYTWPSMCTQDVCTLRSGAGDSRVHWGHSVVIFESWHIIVVHHISLPRIPLWISLVIHTCVLPIFLSICENVPRGLSFTIWPVAEKALTPNLLFIYLYIYVNKGNNNNNKMMGGKCYALIQIEARVLRDLNKSRAEREEWHRTRVLALLPRSRWFVQ